VKPWTKAEINKEILPFIIASSLKNMRKYKEGAFD